MGFHCNLKCFPHESSLIVPADLLIYLEGTLRQPATHIENLILFPQPLL